MGIRGDNWGSGWKLGLKEGFWGVTVEFRVQLVRGADSLGL